MMTAPPNISPQNYERVFPPEYKPRPPPTPVYKPTFLLLLVTQIRYFIYKYNS